MKTIRLKSNNQPWFDDELRNITYERNRIHTFALNYPSNYPIWDRFRQFRNRCKSRNHKKMCDYFKDKLFSHCKTSNKFRTFYKSFIKTKKSGSNQIIGKIFDLNTNQLLSAPIAISQAFNQNFTSIKCDCILSNENCSNFVNNSFLSYKRNGILSVKTFSFKRITPYIEKNSNS